MTAHVGEAVSRDATCLPRRARCERPRAAGWIVTMAPYSRSRTARRSGRERGPSSEEDAPAVGRQAPVVEQVPGIEEHAPVGVDRGGEVRIDGFGGDHVAPDGKDARPSHGTSRRLVAPLVATTTSAHRSAPRDVSSSYPWPRRCTSSTVVAPCSTAPDASTARIRPAASLAGWIPALRPTSSPPRNRSDPISPRTSAGVEEAALLADRRVRGGEGALMQRHAVDGGQAPDVPVVASRIRCRARARGHRRLRRRPRSRPRAVARRAGRETPRGLACLPGAPCRRCDCSPRPRCRPGRGR